MVTVSELGNGGTPLAASLAEGVADISYNATLTFQQWTRTVLPLDGYVFWLQGSTFPATGMLHWHSTRQQNEDETAAANAVVFTTTEELVSFNEIMPTTLITSEIEGMIFSFSAYGMHADQAGLWHYQGEGLQPVEEIQFITDPAQLDPTKTIVSDSLPAWIAAAAYNPVWLNPANPGIPVFPSFAVPQNQPPPYAAVHIEPAQMRALQAAPSFWPDPDLITGTHFAQLVAEQVRVTLYGCDSDTAHDFVGLVLQYMRDQNVIGLMNMPAIRDEKRTAAEAMILAQKKVVDFEVSYVRQRINQIALQLIEEALVTVIARDPGGSAPPPITGGLTDERGNVLMDEAGNILTAPV